ncbi:MAG TPA: alpha/beta hydrolase [Baekduia sp.]
MTSAQLERAIQAQRDFKELLAGAQSLDEVRALDATEIPKWSGPLPDDVTAGQIDLGGVPAETVTPADVAGDRVLMYLHGGGLVLGTPATVRTPVAKAAKLARATGILPRYRLSPEHLFPAQVDDVVAAYRALIASGTPPESIVLAGESAGGGLVCMVLLALRDAGDPMPAAAVPISPMVDLEFKGASWQTNADKDGFVDHELAKQNVPVFLPDGDPAAISAINQDLTGLPPLLIQVGGDECIRDDALAFAEKARAAGVDVTLEVWDGMVHLWHNFSYLPEAQEAIEHIGRFVEARTSVPASPTR